MSQFCGFVFFNFSWCQRRTAIFDCGTPWISFHYLFGNLILKIIWATSWQNQQNGMCAQWRLRSAWASVQSDQTLGWRMMKAWALSYPWSAQQRLIRLGWCSGWSESLLGAHATLLVLSLSGSFLSRGQNNGTKEKIWVKCRKALILTVHWHDSLFMVFRIAIPVIAGFLDDLFHCLS